MVHRQTLCLPFPSSCGNSKSDRDCVGWNFKKNLNLLPKAIIQDFLQRTATQEWKPSHQILKCQDKQNESWVIRCNGWQASMTGCFGDLRWAIKGRGRETQRGENTKQEEAWRASGSITPTPIPNYNKTCSVSGRQPSSLALQVPRTHHNTDV